MIEKAFEEKMRVSHPYTLSDVTKVPENKYHTSLGSKSAIRNHEKIVSADPAAESEVHIVINPTDTNNIIASPIGGGQQLNCPVYYSKDFGSTWLKSSFLNMPANGNQIVAGGGDPILAFDANGRAYFVWINLYIRTSLDSAVWGMYWAYSDDGGVTWIRPANDKVAESTAAAPGGNINVNDFTHIFDKEWAAADISSASPNKNNLYVALMELDQANQNLPIGIVVRRKPAGSDAFLPSPTPVSNNSFLNIQFCGIDVDYNGGIHVTFFGTKNQTSWGLYHALSSNAGVSFGSPVKIADVHFPAFSADEPTANIIGMMRLDPGPHVAVDKSKANGNIYAVWCANGLATKLTNGLDIYFSRSQNNGASWSAPMIVNDDTKGITVHQHTPSIAVSDKGVVAVSFYDRRDDVSGQNYTEYYLTYSFDEGAFFVKNIKVTTKSTMFATVGGQNGGFGLGEYVWLATSPGYAIPVWTDGRTNDGNLEIYAAFVPITSIEFAGVEKIVSLHSDFVLNGPFPDPAQTIISLSVKARQATGIEIILYDMQGKSIYREVYPDLKSGEHSFSIPVDELGNGTYFCQVRSSQGKEVRRFVVAKD